MVARAGLNIVILMFGVRQVLLEHSSKQRKPHRVLKEDISSLIYTRKCSEIISFYKCQQTMDECYAF